MISIKKFFKEDYSRTIGIYFDGNKIYLVRLGEEIEVFESAFEIDLNEEISAAEQLADKVFFLCSQHGWDTSKTALCLREGESIAVQAEFGNIPDNKKDAAVKSWAIAQAGENALYTFAEVCGEYWAETISQAEAAKYISAWEKNSMNLCVMTSLTGSFSDKAACVARIATEKKIPNLLQKQMLDWNFKKIFITVIGIFFIATAAIFGKTFYDFNLAKNNFETLQKNLAAQKELIELKKFFDSEVSETQKLNSLIESQLGDKKLTDLIKIGQIADNKISLTKINFSKTFLELEGVAESATDVKNYLGRFKNSISKNAKLEKISTQDDNVIFKIKLEIANKTDKKTKSKS